MYTYLRVYILLRLSWVFLFFIWKNLMADGDEEMIIRKKVQIELENILSKKERFNCKK